MSLCSEEEQLYVPKIHLILWNGLSPTDQGKQHQEIHRGGGERVKTLDVHLCLHVFIEWHHYLAFPLHCISIVASRTYDTELV